MDVIRGFGKEPYCSQACYDVAGRKMGEWRDAGLVGKCHFCKTEIRLGGPLSLSPWGEKASYKAQVYYIEGDPFFVCQKCEEAGKAESYFQQTNKCCSCAKVLSEEPMVNSSTPVFSMKIESILSQDEGKGMVAGIPQGILPGAGDEVEIVGQEGVLKAIIRAHTTMGPRAGFSLECKDFTSIKEGDTLQFRKAITRRASEQRLNGEQIWKLVGPSALDPNIKEAIVAYGEEVVPVLIDIFSNPFDRYGEKGLADQVILASALVDFAKQGNDLASEYLRDIANGIYPAYGVFGSSALKLAKEYVDSIKAPKIPQHDKEMDEGREPKRQVVVGDKAASMRYADFWSRAVALFVDFIVWYFVIFLIVILSMVPFMIRGVKASENEEHVVAYLSFFIGSFIVYGLPLWIWNGQTLGKKALGIKVIDARGNEKLSWLQCIGRPLAYLISAGLLYVGFLLCIWDKKKQCLHDKIAKTLVVKLNATRGKMKQPVRSQKIGQVDKIKDNGEKDPERMYQNALNLIHQKKYREAADILEETAGLNPNSAPVQFTLGFTYINISGDYKDNEDEMQPWLKKTADCYKRALENNTKYGGLTEKNITVAKEFIMAYERITEKKSPSIAEERRRKIFADFMEVKDSNFLLKTNVAIEIGKSSSSGFAAMNDAVKRNIEKAESATYTEICVKYEINEGQLQAIIEEGKEKNWPFRGVSV